MENLQTIVDNNMTVIGAMLMTMSDVLDYKDKDNVERYVDSIKKSLDKFILDMRNDPLKAEDCETKHVVTASPGTSSESSTTKPAVVRRRRIEPRLTQNIVKESASSIKFKAAGKKSLELKIKWKKLTQDSDMKVFVGKMMQRLGSYWRKYELRDLKAAWMKLKGDCSDDQSCDDSNAENSSSNANVPRRQSITPAKVRREMTRKSIGAPVVAHAFGSSFPVPPETGSQRPTGTSQPQLHSQSSLLKSRYEQSRVGASKPLLASDLYEPPLIVPQRRDSTASEPADITPPKRVSSSDTLNSLLQREAPSSPTSQQQPAVGNRGDDRSHSSSGGGDYDCDRDYLYSDSDPGTPDSFKRSPLDSSGSHSDPASCTASPELFDAETGEPIHSAESAVAMLFSSIQNPSAEGEVPNVRTVNDYWLGSEPITEESAAVDDLPTPGEQARSEVEETEDSPGAVDALDARPERDISVTPPMVAPVPLGDAELQEEINAIRAQSLFSAVQLPTFSYLQSDLGLARQRTPKRESSAPDLSSMSRPAPLGVVGDDTVAPSEAELLEELAAIRRQSLLSAEHLPSFMYKGSDSTGVRPVVPELEASGYASDGAALDYFDCDSLADGVELPP